MTRNSQNTERSKPSQSSDEHTMRQTPSRNQEIKTIQWTSGLATPSIKQIRNLHLHSRSVTASKMLLHNNLHQTGIAVEQHTHNKAKYKLWRP
ncbi:hypothetical protein DY000_02050389 [Brassica cretica]|uniref:Uncharacterized protein n=1 Tax=Brassica cretica TaxID=69181 RepID=A0ABQ7F5X3_BRACR|nr:hypothetical protein DY000_02050389 [Brassica cretica]